MFGVKTTWSLIVVAVISGFMFIWFGVFNVAANDKHWAITNTFLELVRDRSIGARAEISDAPDLADAARIKRGAANYEAMCAQCHLAPGVDSSELYQGLYPKPPVLYKNASFASKPNETFWVIKNGIKMTGMPAWGINNSDEQIWDMIALVSALDTMSVAQYRKLVASGKHTHKGDDVHEHSNNEHGTSGSHYDSLTEDKNMNHHDAVSGHDKTSHTH